jgi:hypothetical protein
MTAKNHMFAEHEFFLMARSGENLFDIDIPPGPEQQPVARPDDRSDLRDESVFLEIT